MLGHVGVNENLMKPSTFQQGCFKLSWEENDGWWQSQALCRLNGMRFSHLKKELQISGAAAGNSGCFFLLFGSPPHWLSIGRWVGPSCTSQQNSQLIKPIKAQGWAEPRLPLHGSRHGAFILTVKLACCGGKGSGVCRFLGLHQWWLPRTKGNAHSESPRPKTQVIHKQHVPFFLQANEGVKQHPFPRDDHHLDISCDQSIQTMG